MRGLQVQFTNDKTRPEVQREYTKLEWAIKQYLDSFNRKQVISKVNLVLK